MPPPGLPIDPQLGNIAATLRPEGATLLLQAPPGAGKTTRVPLCLLESLGEIGTILMLEPRRLATRAAAQRLAAELGETVGARVGYRVRLESCCSAATRLEVMTAGLFLRRLQADPALEGVACVIVDEVHERGAEIDLALALVRQARSLLRPDLRLLLMSATLDLAPWAERLDGAAVLQSEGRSWPVTVDHQPPREGERLERQLLRALEQHWLERRGPHETVLVFLPGQRELLAARRSIEACDWAQELELALLHGQLSLQAQAAAMAPARRPAGKVVLATSIAESSLTLEGVTLVIDSGLSRRSRFDPSTGMDALVTVPASQASAEQRRGRAGRLGPGRCLRLWSPAEQQRRPAFDAPELLEVDPLPIALQLAQWGAGLGEGLDWIDSPPRSALVEARRLLGQLGALDSQGTLTPHGRRLAGLGLHPRLAHMLVLAQEHGWLELACSLAVLLSERDPLDRRSAGCDLLQRLDWLNRAAASPQERQEEAPRRQLRRLQQHLQRQVLASSPAGAGALPCAATSDDATSDGTITARLLSWAYPERIALARGRGDGRFLLRSGRGAAVHPDDALAGSEALAIATLDGHGPEARVLLAVPLPREVLEGLAAEEGESLLETRWLEREQRVSSERTLRLGALVLERHPWAEAEGAAVTQALLEGVRGLGLAALPWCPRSRGLQRRLCLAHRHLGEPWPDRSPERLEEDLASWLGPHLEGLSSLQQVRQIDLCEILWGDLSWAQRRELDGLLPEDLPIPSGRRARLNYEGEDPVLAVKLQEMFGCSSTPRLLAGRLPVTVQLLSPAGRPAAITRDLEDFWNSGYHAVRRELRGRYPKHPWPEDPRQAEATALTRVRFERGGGTA